MEPAQPPARELTDAERDALAALLTDAFSTPSEDEIEDLVLRWSARNDPAVLENARSAARSLLDGSLLDEPMFALLQALGLGFDPYDHERVGVVDFLEILICELARALGEPPEDEDPEDGD